MKSYKLLAALISIACCMLMLTAGCEEAPLKAPAKGKVFLSVDFQPAQALRYRFTSKRDVVIDWKPGETDSKGKKGFSENIDMVVAYEPIEVDPYGLTTVKATFESVNAKKSSGTGRDAANTLTGKSFTFKVNPNGKIQDLTELRELLVKASKAAFRKGKNIKAPDMLDDVIASQWYLWDTAASIKKPAKGIKPGQTWQSRMLIPTTMVIRKGRSVTYKLDKVRQDDTGRIAVISSTYANTEELPDIPLPYEGSFKISGAFGFFRSAFGGYDLISIEGAGEELYNTDAGRIEKSTQQYKVVLKPKKMPLPGANPHIHINQTIVMELIQ